MDPSSVLSVFLTITAAAMGACIGSFLNVCIYRIPREDCQVHHPKRSFCPSCKYQLPWYVNIPVLSWLVLRGKCAHCSQAISFRYPAVEALTAVFFVWIWLSFPPAMAIAYWFMISFFIVATFIDIDLQIIPDCVSLGAAGVGVVASIAVPQLMGEDFWFHALGWSVFAAFLSYGVIWAVILGGKLAFGRRKLNFSEETEWILNEPEGSEEPVLQIADEAIGWSDIFCRGSDRLLFKNGWVAIEGGEKRPFDELRFRQSEFILGGETFDLEKITHLSGGARHVTMSREAMGYGDAKFMMGVGAFLGWQAIPFTLFAGSILGTLLWLVSLPFGKGNISRRIPFGPYLAAGAIIWLFYGRGLVDWYLGLIRPNPFG